MNDSLVIDVRTGKGDSEILAFIVPAAGTDRAALEPRIREAIRTSLSPRFNPDHIYAVAAIPRTLSMKKQELPIRRLFEGCPLAEAIDTAAMVNPGCLDEYVDLAQAFARRRREPAIQV